jgi:hypothetical protein
VTGSVDVPFALPLKTWRERENEKESEREKAMA